jgi:hypothetical protein
MKLRVSDHALLRYFERVAGFDIEGLRLQLAATLERGAGAAESIGGGHYVIRCAEAGYVVKNNVVVTILAPDMGAASLSGDGA